MDWISPLIGGMLIGFAAAALMWLHGRVAGISGIFAGILQPTEGEWDWRLAFVGGLVVGGLLLVFLEPSRLPDMSQIKPVTLIVGGLLVGIGTRLGSGCTSGHGVCGLARFSPRSLAATMTFMAFGFLTVTLLRHVF